MTVRAMLISGREVIVLSGGDGGAVLQNDSVAPYDTQVGVRFNTDGTIETGKSLNGAAIIWSAAGDWIDPTSDADSSYSVRFTNFNGAGGGNWTAESAADDVWIGLGSQRIWRMRSTAFEDINFTADFEVRKTAGAPPATGSASYTFSIENQV